MAASGKRLGASNFTLPEINILLDCIEDKLPIGHDEWELVADVHIIS